MISARAALRQVRSSTILSFAAQPAILDIHVLTPESVIKSGLHPAHKILRHSLTTKSLGRSELAYRIVSDAVAIDTEYPDMPLYPLGIVDIESVQ